MSSSARQRLCHCPVQRKCEGYTPTSAVAPDGVDDLAGLEHRFDSVAGKVWNVVREQFSHDVLREDSSCRFGLANAAATSFDGHLKRAGIGGDADALGAPCGVLESLRRFPPQSAGIGKAFGVE